MTAIAADIPEALQVEISDIRYALASGWRDFRQAPIYGVVFALVFVLGGWTIYGALSATGQMWWALAAAAGFPILGPFIAAGLYEVSRRMEQGIALNPPSVFGAILRQKDRQIPSIAAVILVFFLFWNFLAHMIFALFLGNASLINVSSSLAVFATPEGLSMLAVGTAVGAVFATLLFSLTVVSLPMLMDREVDFVTAMLTSLSVVRTSPWVMLGWGGFIGLVLFVAMLPGFLGLFPALPVLGHASWHLYRRAVSWA